MNQTQNPPPPKPKQKRVLTEERKQVLRDQLTRGREKSLHLRTMTRKLDSPEFTTTLEDENLPPKPAKVPKQPKVMAPAYSYEKIDELITNIKELTKAQKAKMDKKEKLEKEREEKEKEKEDDNFLLLPIKKPEQKQHVVPTTSAYYVPTRAIRTRKF